MRTVGGCGNIIKPSSWIVWSVRWAVCVVHRLAKRPHPLWSNPDISFVYFHCIDALLDSGMKWCTMSGCDLKNPILTFHSLPSVLYRQLLCICQKQTSVHSLFRTTNDDLLQALHVLRNDYRGMLSIMSGFVSNRGTANLKRLHLSNVLLYDWVSHQRTEPEVFYKFQTVLCSRSLKLRRRSHCCQPS